MSGADEPADEARLLARWQEEDDREALEQLLRAEVAGLKRFVQKSGAATRPTSVSDVAQEAVVRLLQASASFPSPAALRAFLWTTARNLLVDRMRRARRATLTLGADETRALCADPSTSGELGRVESDDLGHALELVVNLLRPADQEILREVYFRGRSIDEAGAALGVPRDVANTRLVRARVRLAEKLSSWREVVES